MTESPPVTGRFGRSLDALLGAIGAIVLFSMMILTFVDVVLRYLFNSPLRGAFEVTELMLVVLIFGGLPLVSRHDQHVTTDLIDAALTPWMSRVLAVIIHLICAIALAGVGWLIFVKAGKLAQTGDTTQILRIALSPFVYLVAFLIFVTAVIHVVKAFRRELGEGSSQNI